MSKNIKNHLRRFVSLSAFSVLIAAVTMAYADAPKKQTDIYYEEFEPMEITVSRPDLKLASTNARAIPSNANAAAPEKVAKPPLTGTLNLNTANEDELVKLPGVGPKKAERIVSWRSAHGKFQRVVDLRRVKGFGAKSVKKLMPYLSVKGPNTLQ